MCFRAEAHASLQLWYLKNTMCSHINTYFLFNMNNMCTILPCDCVPSGERGDEYFILLKGKKCNSIIITFIKLT